MSKKHGMGKFVFGALFGAGLGLLFAPNKGSETREYLKKRCEELADQIKNMDGEEVKKELKS